jgi:hypothetical protein
MRSLRLSPPFAATAALAALLMMSAPPIKAQDLPDHLPDPHAPQKQMPAPPKELPKLGGDKLRNLDFLFGALKAAPDDTSARHVEARIWAIWSATPSDTAALLMARAKLAMEVHNLDLALKLLDTVVKLRPDYIEGWNRRATAAARRWPAPCGSACPKASAAGSWPATRPTSPGATRCSRSTWWRAAGSSRCPSARPTWR